MERSELVYAAQTAAKDTYGSGHNPLRNFTNRLNAILDEMEKVKQTQVQEIRMEAVESETAGTGEAIQLGPPDMPPIKNAPKITEEPKKKKKFYEL